MSKRKLGRGLSSLLAARTPSPTATSAVTPETMAIPTPQSVITQIPTASIQPNRWQPRTEVSDDTLDGLAESIRRDGLLQPIVVRAAKDGVYELIAGERRWRATMKAGIETIPATVRDVDDNQALELALIENVQRDDLNPIEQAKAYKQLKTVLNLSQEEVATRLGQQRSTLANFLRLLELPEELQELVSRGTITAGHARAILGLPDGQTQLVLAKRIIKEGLSVRATEAVVARLVGRKPTAKAAARAKPPHIRELEDRLAQALGTAVTVKERRRGGRIIIDFASHNDFDRLINMLAPETDQTL